MNVSPFGFARPEARLILEPEVAAFLGLFPETEAKGQTQPQKKKAYPNLRQATLPPDTVEAVRLWKAGHGHGTRYSKALSKIQARSEQREAKVQGVSSKGEVWKGVPPRIDPKLCGACTGRKPHPRNKGMIFGNCANCCMPKYLFR